MWKKLIVSVVLLAFVGLQFANSLTCYSSNSLTQEQCNNATANATTTWLRTWHTNVPPIAGNNRFRCMNLTYYYAANNAVIASRLGCYYEQIAVCNLQLNLATSAKVIKACTTCNTNLCNRNPAGTLSRSTYTIFAAVVAVILAGVFSK